MTTTIQAELFKEVFTGARTVFEPRDHEPRLAHGQEKNPGIISGPPMPAPAISFSGQTADILHYLQSGYSITPIEALNKFGCFRLGARAWDLKKAGYAIKSEIIEIKNEDGTKKHVARYSLT